MNRSWIIAAALSAGAAWAAGGCLDVRDPAPTEHKSNCTTCHGSPQRSGDALAQSAPPFDLSGRSDPQRRGVGAHLVHLTGTTHRAVPCDECHLVPQRTEDPGHADTALPAEVHFGSLAQHGGHLPSYRADELACSGSYCHSGREVGWLPSPSPKPSCTGCHGMPPPPPHPQSDACAQCHGEVIDELGALIAPALHVDGQLQLQESCSSCHGSGPEGLPPPDLSGSSDPARVGVGAHAIHAEGGSTTRPVACNACHAVPLAAGDDGHLDDSPAAELTFGAVALAGGRLPSWDRGSQRCSDGWCHGPSPGAAASPPWTQGGGGLDCQSCHGMPPAPPHPQMEQCELCHAPTIDALGNMVRERHVDGTVDVVLPDGCDGCHGSGTLGAPPPDLAGNVDPSSPGVGAHAAHLTGGLSSRPVPCGECHTVPSDTLASGHLDSALPAELSFSGVASAYTSSPSYDGARCSNSYCHGAVTIFGFPSGGSATEPLWTLTDGSQAQCDSCHALPPATPGHPSSSPVFCSDCHSNVSGLLDIVDPTLHVDGKVDL
jgi:predicted CxxxxCH...CXXCH cytochrome family protein